MAAAEWRLLGWMERNGLDYDYYSETQFHFDKVPLDKYRVLIISTHPEYWSKEMYFKLKKWVFEEGGRLIYLGGNGLNCEVEFLESLAEFIDICRIVVLSQFLPDGFELLSKEHLTLAFPEFLLHLRFYVGLSVQQTDLSLHMQQHSAQAFLYSQSLQKALPILWRYIGVAGYEVCKFPRVVHTFQHLLNDLFWDALFFSKLRGALTGFAIQCLKRGTVRFDCLQIARLEYNRFEIFLRFVVLEHGPSHFPLEE